MSDAGGVGDVRMAVLEASPPFSVVLVVVVAAGVRDVNDAGGPHDSGLGAT
jgi:hypothetical protein